MNDASEPDAISFLVIGLFLGLILLVVFVAKYGGRELRNVSWGWRILLGLIVLVGNAALFVPAVDDFLQVGTGAIISTVLVGILPEYVLMLLGVVRLDSGDPEHDGSVSVWVDRQVQALHSRGADTTTLNAVIDSSPLTPTKKDELKQYWAAVANLPHDGHSGGAK